MTAEGTGNDPAVTTRRYTGANRADAEAGFKFDWPRLAGRYALLAETWDPDTHTLSVMLRPLAGDDEARPASPAR